MKKTMRIGAIMKILTDAPSRNFSLKYFCDTFHYSLVKVQCNWDFTLTKSKELNIIEMSTYKRLAVMYVSCF